MSLENDLQTLLLTKCPRVFPRKAPNGTANPYIIWDRQGGESFVYLDNTSSGKRKPLILVSMWSKTLLEAIQINKEVADAIRACPLFVATETGEPVDRDEEAPDVYGCQQFFEIFADR